jgi:hypothetical protein
MEVLINITSEEGQQLLKGLSYLYKQAGIQSEEKEELTKLGSKLSKSFGKIFEWKFGIGKQTDVFNHFINKKINIRLKG